MSEKIITNKEFARINLTDICNSNDIVTTWSTKRQASKYRNQKGRVYKTIKCGKEKSFGNNYN